MVRYAIIENEDYAYENLRSYVQELRPDYKEVYHGDSVEDCIAWFESKQQVDLIFMDIELNDGNCFEIFEAVQILTPVVFTTAYDTYLMQAFDANSIGYLLKPITALQLEKALSKFEQIRQPVDNQEILNIGLARAQKNLNRLLVNKGDEYSYINIADVAMFISEDKYVFAVTKSGRRHILGVSSLKGLVEKLDQDIFFLISRGCIVNIEAIVSVKKHFANKLKVTIKVGDKTVSEIISSSRKRDFLNWFGN